MATYARSVRRGLPRVSGGDPWPPAGDPVAPAPGTQEIAAEAVSRPDASPEPVAAAVEPVPGTTDAASADVSRQIGSPERFTRIRRGLPRESGGDPWPPVTDAAPTATSGAAGVVPAVAPEAASPAPASLETAELATSPEPHASAEAPASSQQAPAGSMRRGLPRAVGGDPWPPAGTAPVRPPEPTTHTAEAPTAPASVPAPASGAAPASPAEAPPASAPSPAAVTPASPAGPRPSLAERPLAHAGVARRPAPRPEPARIGPLTKTQWAGVVVLGGGAILYAAAMAVLAVRWILSLEPLQDFLATYPGEYHLPEGAPVGFPAWLNWSHFLNAFFMVLIIRTGLQVRSEKRPAAMWISKKDRKRRMSLTLWLHQALDILWLANGLMFVVLLFATGQWMRVIPTSWEVFPNALSAALQYVSLDWPTENGWVNYNALQQLAYFTTIFIAAPVAALTGYRMSAMWPKQAATLNRVYPVEWARKLHFPTMLYFVAFIAVHVLLVLSTGALRNLNHMYAAQGSTDPDAYADNWTGFWLFALSIAVIVAAYVAMRPLVVAPIARLFGEVKSR